MESKYLRAAQAVMRFINTRKRQGPEGIFWSLEDAATGRTIYYDEVCMYAGASGIICFLLNLYQVTGESAYLEEAREAAKYLKWRWENERTLKRNFSSYAFSSGWSGVGYALLQLYRVTRDEEYSRLVSEIAEQILQNAEKPASGTGYRWSSYPGIVGNAGTVLFLLYASKQLKQKRWKDFAIEAGRSFLGMGRDMGQGRRYYPGVDPQYFGAGDDYIDPNFPMGTGGIGFTLLRLYEESGDEVFLNAVKGVPEYMESVAVPVGKAGKGRLLPHALPDRPNLFYLGYCHGPAGTCRFFYKLWEMTGEDKYAKIMQDLVEGVKETGAPEVRTDGYWNTYNVCCGTAGLVNLFLGLWAADGNQEYLDLAKRCGDVLLKDAVGALDVKDAKIKWRFALDRIAPERVSTPIGFFDGAAGIGAMLLQLHMAENGGFEVHRFIDDPFPSSASGTNGGYFASAKRK